MYTTIRDVRLGVYDGETDEHLGDAVFQLTPQAESDLLNLVNYGITPVSLVISNADFYPASDKYVPPKPYGVYKRKGKFMASFADSYTGANVPIEIDIKYDQIIRSPPTRRPYYFDSVGFNNIVVESVSQKY